MTSKISGPKRSFLVPPNTVNNCKPFDSSSKNSINNKSISWQKFHSQPNTQEKSWVERINAQCVTAVKSQRFSDWCGGHERLANEYKAEGERFANSKTPLELAVAKTLIGGSRER